MSCGNECPARAVAACPVAPSCPPPANNNCAIQSTKKNNCCEIPPLPQECAPKKDDCANKSCPPMPTTDCSHCRPDWIQCEPCFSKSYPAPDGVTILPISIGGRQGGGGKGGACGKCGQEKSGGPKVSSNCPMMKAKCPGNNKEKTGFFAKLASLFGKDEPATSVSELDGGRLENVCQSLNVEDEKIRHHRNVFNPQLVVRRDGYLCPNVKNTQLPASFGVKCQGEFDDDDDDDSRRKCGLSSPPGSCNSCNYCHIPPTPPEEDCPIEQDEEEEEEEEYLCPCKEGELVELVDDEDEDEDDDCDEDEDEVEYEEIVVEQQVNPPTCAVEPEPKSEPKPDPPAPTCPTEPVEKIKADYKINEPTTCCKDCRQKGASSCTPVTNFVIRVQAPGSTETCDTILEKLCQSRTPMYPEPAEQPTAQGEGSDCNNNFKVIEIIKESTDTCSTPPPPEPEAQTPTSPTAPSSCSSSSPENQESIEELTLNSESESEQEPPPPTVEVWPPPPEIPEETEIQPPETEIQPPEMEKCSTEPLPESPPKESELPPTPCPEIKVDVPAPVVIEQCEEPKELPEISPIPVKQEEIPLPSTPEQPERQPDNSYSSKQQQQEPWDYEAKPLFWDKEKEECATPNVPKPSEPEPQPEVISQPKAEPEPEKPYSCNDVKKEEQQPVPCLPPSETEPIKQESLPPTTCTNEQVEQKIQEQPITTPVPTSEPTIEKCVPTTPPSTETETPIKEGLSPTAPKPQVVQESPKIDVPPVEKKTVFNKELREHLHKCYGLGDFPQLDPCLKWDGETPSFAKDPEIKPDEISELPEENNPNLKEHFKKCYGLGEFPELDPRIKLYEEESKDGQEINKEEPKESILHLLQDSCNVPLIEHLEKCYEFGKIPKLIPNCNQKDSKCKEKEPLPDFCFYGPGSKPEEPEAMPNDQPNQALKNHLKQSYGLIEEEKDPYYPFERPDMNEDSNETCSQFPIVGRKGLTASQLCRLKLESLFPPKVEQDDTPPPPSCAACGATVRGENDDCAMCAYTRKARDPFVYDYDYNSCHVEAPEKDECFCKEDERKCDSDVFDMTCDGKPMYEGGMCITRASHFLWKSNPNENSIKMLGLETDCYDGFRPCRGRCDCNEGEEGAEVEMCECEEHKYKGGMSQAQYREYKS